MYLTINAMKILNRLYEFGFYHFTLICLWHPESKAYYLKCYQSHREWSLSGLKASGASKAAVIDTVMIIPRMILVLSALILLNIFCFIGMVK
jgi:hypothetical protein